MRAPLCCQDPGCPGAFGGFALLDFDLVYLLPILRTSDPLLSSRLLLSVTPSINPFAIPPYRILPPAFTSPPARGGLLKACLLLPSGSSAASQMLGQPFFSSSQLFCPDVFLSKGVRDLPAGSEGGFIDGR